jgi:hypothetical protein
MKAINVYPLRIHNITVVRLRRGWTIEDVRQAIADADRGVSYQMPKEPRRESRVA